MKVGKVVGLLLLLALASSATASKILQSLKEKTQARTKVKIANLDNLYMNGIHSFNKAVFVEHALTSFPAEESRDWFKDKFKANIESEAICTAEHWMNDRNGWGLFTAGTITWDKKHAAEMADQTETFPALVTRVANANTGRGTRPLLVAVVPEGRNEWHVAVGRQNLAREPEFVKIKSAKDDVLAEKGDLKRASWTDLAENTGTVAIDIGVALSNYMLTCMPTTMHNKFTVIQSEYPDKEAIYPWVYHTGFAFNTWAWWNHDAIKTVGVMADYLHMGSKLVAANSVALITINNIDANWDCPHPGDAVAAEGDDTASIGGTTLNIKLGSYVPRPVIDDGLDAPPHERDACSRKLNGRRPGKAYKIAANELQQMMSPGGIVEVQWGTNVEFNPATMLERNRRKKWAEHIEKIKKYGDSRGHINGVCLAQALHTNHAARIHSISDCAAHTTFPYSVDSQTLKMVHTTGGYAKLDEYGLEDPIVDNCVKIQFN